MRIAKRTMRKTGCVGFSGVWPLLLPAALFALAVPGFGISIPSARERVLPPARAASLPSARPATLSAALVPYEEGKRDPFRLPPPPIKGAKARGRASLALPPGPAGLLIDQLQVRGIVSDDGGRRMIAVVTDGDDVAYFLRSGEAVYDGVVTSIAPDAVNFRQRINGAHSSVTFREVVKRLIPRKPE